MKQFAVRTPVLLGVLWVCCVTGTAGAAPSSTELHQKRLAELTALFDPVAVASSLEPLRAPLLIGFQAIAAVIVIGVMLHRLRLGGELMDVVASTILKVFFISSVSLWSGLITEGVDAFSGAVGYSFAPSSSTPDPSAPKSVAAPGLPDKLWTLEQQWSLDSSPVQDTLEGAWKPGDGKEEENLGKSWNWAKPTVVAAESEAERQWSVASNAERAGLVQRLVMGVGACVQATTGLCYLLQDLRLVLWSCATALSPMMIAGLGLSGWALPSTRGLLAGCGIALWPLGWTLANAISGFFLGQLLTLLVNTNSSAMYPKVPPDSVASIALSAPFLSWSLLVLVAVLTLLVCVWVLGSQILVAFSIQRLLGSGAGAVG